MTPLANFLDDPERRSHLWHPIEYIPHLISPSRFTVLSGYRSLVIVE